MVKYHLLVINLTSEKMGEKKWNSHIPLDIFQMKTKGTHFSHESWKKFWLLSWSYCVDSWICGMHTNTLLAFPGHRSNNSLAKTGKKLYNPERCISCTVKLSQKQNKKLCSDWLKGPSSPPAQTPDSKSKSLILFTTRTEWFWRNTSI